MTSATISQPKLTLRQALKLIYEIEALASRTGPKHRTAAKLRRAKHRTGSARCIQQCSAIRQRMQRSSSNPSRSHLTSQ